MIGPPELSRKGAARQVPNFFRSNGRAQRLEPSKKGFNSERGPDPELHDKYPPWRRRLEQLGLKSEIEAARLSIPRRPASVDSFYRYSIFSLIQVPGCTGVGSCAGSL